MCYSSRADFNHSELFSSSGDLVLGGVQIEADISASQQAPQKKHGFPRPLEICRRTQRPCSSPRKRAQAPCSLAAKDWVFSIPLHYGLNRDGNTTLYSAPAVVLKAGWCGYCSLSPQTEQRATAWRSASASPNHICATEDAACSKNLSGVSIHG